MRADVISTKTLLDGARSTASDVLSLFDRGGSTLAGSSQHDLYLSPHFDDVCFSLGGFAARRRQGILLTFFSNSIHVATHTDDTGRAMSNRLAVVSALRREEDLAFARKVGLHQVIAGLDEATFRGRGSWDTEKSADDAVLLNQRVVTAIMTAVQSRPIGPRPWLFCPMGIGGHVDHVTILRIVLKNYDALQTVYRIGFYEDLHYASNWRVRRAGLARFRGLVAGYRPKRSMHLIGDVQHKLALINLYRSQFVQPPASMERFTPRLFFPSPAHEAIWTEEAFFDETDGKRGKHLRARDPTLQIDACGPGETLDF
jgi:LmbE family N-acetylglucosaminyl deacetylase